MSDFIAKELQVEPFIFLEDENEDIVFPDFEKVTKAMEAIFFPKQFVAEVCKRYNYDAQIINEFIGSSQNPEIHDDDPEKNIVNIKPIVEIKDGFLVYMPTGISTALISFISKQAIKFSCKEGLLELLYIREFHNTSVALTKMSWLSTDISLPSITQNLKLKESVWQFDNQKLAYVCLYEGRNSQVSTTIDKATDALKARANEVSVYLKSLQPEQPLEIFCLFVLPITGEDFMFLWPKDVGDQALGLTYSELLTIAYSKDIDKLGLWKFAKNYRTTGEKTRFMHMGILDAYVTYLGNQGNLFDSDSERPLGGILLTGVGTSSDFEREVAKIRDEHSVPIFYQGRRAFSKVTRYKPYAPIYIEREISDYFRLVVETYKMPIWITNYQVNGLQENWATYVCEAIAFWLNKMGNLLEGYLVNLTLIQFEIEVVIANSLLQSNEFVDKIIELESFTLEMEVEAPKLKIHIPADFLNVIRLPDNSADKILMKTVLKGVNEYANAAKNVTGLNSAKISEIVDTVFSNPRSKMLFFSDSSSDPRMDDRNLPGMRYLQDADISTVLEDLVSYLTVGTVVPVKFPTIPEKIAFCDLVIKALQEKISEKIALFDGPYLLEWLIKLHEKCIQVREFKELTLPAKIASFSDFKSELDLGAKKSENLIATTLSCRVLIEFVACKIPIGTKWPNHGDVDELMALTYDLINRGLLKETLWLGLDDPEMGLLPSGRIGMDNTFGSEILGAYAIASNESRLYRNIEDFESNYSPSGSTISGTTPDTKKVDDAFIAEFGLTLSKLFIVIRTLIQNGFKRGLGVVSIREDDLSNLLIETGGISKTEIQIAIDLLSLLERGPIDSQDFGVGKDANILPWRYSRPFSYLLRPIVRIADKKGNIFYYGYRHLMDYSQNLLGLLFTGKLPTKTSKEMQAFLGGMSGETGKPFRNAVRDWFKQIPDFEVIDYEIKMKPDAPQNHLKTDADLGDLDLMVINHSTKTVFAIECKNVSGARTVYEMKTEIDQYLGRDQNDKGAKILKHVKRDKWLQANKTSLSQVKPGLDNYIIKSLIMTADEIPLSYLKGSVLPLPIKSFVFLRNKGISYLFDS